MSETPNYFAILTAEVRYNKNLSCFEKLLYAEITALCDKRGYCWATDNYFAELYNVIEKTVSISISRLEKENFLIVIEDENRTKRVIKIINKEDYEIYSK